MFYVIYYGNIWRFQCSNLTLPLFSKKVECRIIESRKQLLGRTVENRSETPVGVSTLNGFAVLRRLG